MCGMVSLHVRNDKDISNIKQLHQKETKVGADHWPAINISLLFVKPFECPTA